MGLEDEAHVLHQSHACESSVFNVRRREQSVSQLRRDLRGLFDVSLCIFSVLLQTNEVGLEGLLDFWILRSAVVLAQQIFKPLMNLVLLVFVSFLRFVE